MAVPKPKARGCAGHCISFRGSGRTPFFFIFLEANSAAHWFERVFGVHFCAPFEVFAGGFFSEHFASCHEDSFLRVLGGGFDSVAVS